MSETPRKGSVQAITDFFTTSNHKPIPRKLRSNKTTPPSTSPPLRAPSEIEPERNKRGNKRKTPPDSNQQPSSPKNSRMDKTETPEKTSPGQKKQQKFLDDIGNLIAKQGEAQKKTLEEHLAQNDDKFEKKIEKALTIVNENFNKKLETSLQPIEERLETSEGQIEILKTQMGKYSETQESMNKLVLESNANLTKALAHINTNTNSISHDPNTSHQRQKLYEELQRENCVLTIQGCTETSEGKKGWQSVLENLTFRNGYDSSKFKFRNLKKYTTPKRG